MGIDCREPHGSYFPDPEDCRHFYHCSDWSGLQKKSCGSHLYFNSQTGVCDWPSVVRRVRPECPDPEALDVHESPRAHQAITSSQAGQLSSVNFPKTSSEVPITSPTTTPVPRARPSVGVPARFPDQSPVVLFDPSEFIQRTQPAAPKAIRFQPQQFRPQPVFSPGSGFQQFPQFPQVQQSAPGRTPASAFFQPAQFQPAQPGLQFGFQPTTTIKSTRPLNRVPVVQARPLQPVAATARPVPITAQPTFTVPEQVRNVPSRGRQRQPVLVPVVKTPQPEPTTPRPIALTFAPVTFPPPPPVPTTTTTTPTTTTTTRKTTLAQTTTTTTTVQITTTTTTTTPPPTATTPTPITTRHRFRARRPLPGSTFSKEVEEEE